MSRISDLLGRSGSDWQAYQPPLADDRIADAMRRIGTTLPASLIELYRACNRGEGSLPYQPWTFVLWGIDEVAQLHEQENYRNYAQFVFFGGNGAGEYFGVDHLGRVFFMDPIAGEESVVVVASTFDQFAEKIGTVAPQSHTQ